jgi:hypothetical protein
MLLLIIALKKRKNPDWAASLIPSFLVGTALNLLKWNSALSDGQMGMLKAKPNKCAVQLDGEGGQTK